MNSLNGKSVHLFITYLNYWIILNSSYFILFFHIWSSIVGNKSSNDNMSNLNFKIRCLPQHLYVTPTLIGKKCLQISNSTLGLTWKITRFVPILSIRKFGAERVGDRNIESEKSERNWRLHSYNKLWTFQTHLNTFPSN